MYPKMQIKGFGDGLIISMQEGSWEEARNVLFKQLDEQKEFLRGARVALDVGEYVVKAVDLVQIRKDISKRDLTLWAILSNSPTTEKAAQDLGLVTQIKKKIPETDGPELDTTIYGEENAILLRRTLRSGFSLQHFGNITVIGDINPGAEIKATRNIIVWGRLRGLVHAGAEGDEDAVVCALDLSPTQLRIAGVIAINPGQSGISQPEIACLMNGQVYIEQWNPTIRRK